MSLEMLRDVTAQLRACQAALPTTIETPAHGRALDALEEALTSLMDALHPPQETFCLTCSRPFLEG